MHITPLKEDKLKAPLDQKNIFIVSVSENDIRFNRWFKTHFPFVHYTRFEKLLRTGQIRIDGKRSKSNTRLKTGQLVRIPPLHILNEHTALQQQLLYETKTPDNRLLEKYRLFLKEITLYEDDDLIAFNKPAGLAVQGGSKLKTHLDFMLESLRDAQGNRPRLVHRLDKDTSGVLLVAKTAVAAAWITAGFYHRSTKKTYWAIVKGVPQHLQGKIDFPLAKKMGDFGETVDLDIETGREAITFYKVKKQFKTEAAWLELNPLTGRMHQLRAHCNLMQTPILGDKKYGMPSISSVLQSFPNYDFSKLHLHAYQIALLNPQGENIIITAPLTQYLKNTWNMLGFTEDS